MVITAAITWIVASEIQQKSSKDKKSDRKELSGNPSLSGPVFPKDRNQRTVPNVRKPESFLSRAERNIEQAPRTPGEVDDHVFNRSAEIAATSGDFGPLSRFFDSLSQVKRDHYFRQVPTIFSKLGPSHDIREKLALLEKVNIYASSLESMRVAVLEREAVERYDEMKEEGILKTLTDKEFAAVCRRIASNRVEKGFTAVEDANSETAMRVAAATVARSAIAGGTMAASKTIAELPAGVIRDKAVAELVLWLRKTNSEDEAAPWEALIIDENSKARLTTAE